MHGRYSIPVRTVCRSGLTPSKPSPAFRGVLDPATYDPVRDMSSYMQASLAETRPKDRGVVVAATQGLDGDDPEPVAKSRCSHFGSLCAVSLMGSFLLLACICVPVFLIVGTVCLLSKDKCAFL